MERRESKQGFLDNIVKAAKKDEKFKTILMKDPKEVIQKKLKIKLPENLKITVLEEKADEIFIVLPLKKEEVIKELNDQELAEVSGGLCWSNGTVFCHIP